MLCTKCGVSISFGTLHHYVLQQPYCDKCYRMNRCARCNKEMPHCGNSKGYCWECYVETSQWIPQIPSSSPSTAPAPSAVDLKLTLSAPTADLRSQASLALHLAESLLELGYKLTALESVSYTTDIPPSYRIELTFSSPPTPKRSDSAQEKMSASH